MACDARAHAPSHSHNRSSRSVPASRGAMDPTVFWPTLLGLCFLAAGMISYRRDFRAARRREGFGLVAMGPAFIAAALAAFAGEHFTLTTSIAALIPAWLPARVFIAWFVG